MLSIAAEWLWLWLILFAGSYLGCLILRLHFLRVGRWPFWPILPYFLLLATSFFSGLMAFYSLMVRLGK